MSGEQNEREIFGRTLTEPDAAAPDQVAPNHRARFDVHRNNVSHARIDTLRSIYPVVQKLVGEQFFTAMAREFIERNPPTSPLLFRYGGNFPDFVSGFPPAETVPYLADVARIEWSRLQAYHARDAEPVSIEALTDVATDDLPALQLRLHPSLGVVRSNWPVFSIWMNSLDPDEERPVDMDEGQSVLILRAGLQVQTELLPDGAELFINELGKGTPMGQAAEIAHAHAPGFDLGAQLGMLFQNGGVVGLG